MIHPSISEPLVLPLFLQLSVSAHVASDDIRVVAASTLFGRVDLIDVLISLSRNGFYNRL
jgi:hypothetical protein